MNGFIFLEAEVQLSGIDSEGLLRLDPQLKVAEVAFGRGDRLLTWGHVMGDVNHCQNPDGSLTVLCGYISEIDFGPAIKHQQHAVTILGKSISRDSATVTLAELLNRIHGSFAVFHRDFKRHIILCLTDRVSSRPMWKLRSNRGWIASSHPLAIAASVRLPEVNLGALGAFMLYGGTVEPRKSLFKDIESFQSGSITRLNSNGSVEEATWYKYSHKPKSELSVSSWLDLACERLISSASRIAKQCDRPAIFFSGGVDSRLTAAALKMVGANPLLVTLGDSRNLEVKVAERAAAAMGLQHIVLLRDKHWYLEGLPKAVFESGGSFVWTHGHFSRAARELSAEFDIEIFLLGDLCEAMSKLLCSVDKGRRHIWTVQEFVRDFDRIPLPLYRPKNRHQTMSLLNSKVRGDVEASLLRDISERYRSICEFSPDPKIVGDMFFRWESLGTCPTFSMFLDLRGVTAERNLMLDKDVLELLEIFPTSLRDSSNFGASLIRRLDPEVSRVPNSNSLLPMCWPPITHTLSKKCKPMFGMVRRLVLGKSYRNTGSWQEKSSLYAGDPLWRNYFDKILSDGDIFPKELFDLDRIRLSWRALLNGDTNSASDIEKLIQFGVMNEQVRSGLGNIVGETALSR